MNCFQILALCPYSVSYNMTWRDIQYIIVMTSRHTGLEDKWTTNGAGYACKLI